jgi:hypothetical protein
MPINDMPPSTTVGAPGASVPSSPEDSACRGGHFTDQAVQGASLANRGTT